MKVEHTKSNVAIGKDSEGQVNFLVHCHFTRVTLAIYFGLTCQPYLVGHEFH